jgi:hypothetical protein
VIRTEAVIRTALGHRSLAEEAAGSFVLGHRPGLARNPDLGSRRPGRSFRSLTS